MGLITNPQGNGVIPLKVGAAALPIGSVVKIASELLVVAASGNRAFGVVLADGAISEENVPVAVSGAIQGTVKAKISANVTATGALLYVGATSGSLTPTDPGGAAVCAKSAGIGSAGGLCDVVLVP